MLHSAETKADEQHNLNLKKLIIVRAILLIHRYFV